MVYKLFPGGREEHQTGSPLPLKGLIDPLKGLYSPFKGNIKEYKRKFQILYRKGKNVREPFPICSKVHTR